MAAEAEAIRIDQKDQWVLEFLERTSQGEGGVGGKGEEEGDRGGDSNVGHESEGDEDNIIEGFVAGRRRKISVEGEVFIFLGG